MMGMLEPVMERVVYEDIPFNLAAIKQRVEELKLQRRIVELEEEGGLHRPSSHESDCSKRQEFLNLHSCVAELELLGLLLFYPGALHCDT